MKTIAGIIFICCFTSVVASYLGYPRIHFSGQFLADANSRNNDFCNYRTDKPFSPDLNIDCNKNGTNEFKFYNCKVTSVVYEDGTSSVSDPVVGRSIIDNLEHPQARVADISWNSEAYSSIFGMKFGIKWVDEFPKERGDIAFHGRWSRSVLGQFVWTRVKCYNEQYHGSQLYQNSFGNTAISTTTITDIDWSNLGHSTALNQLRSGVGDGDLSVRVTMNYYTQNYPPYVSQNATLGYVVGVIGVPSPSDTLNVPGERAMFPKNNPVGLTFDRDDLCYEQNISSFGNWTNFAPFEVDNVRNEVRLDLSSSLSTDISDTVRDIGILRLGVLEDSCIHLLGNGGLPYTSDHDIPLSSAIYTVPVDPLLMDVVANNSIVIVQVLARDEGSSTVCGEDKHTNSVHVILQEYPYFIRPKNYYIGILDRHDHPNNRETVYVTRYGVPLKGHQVDIIASSPPGSLGAVIPANGVIPTTWSAITDDRGMVTFDFKMNKDVRIPPERHYTNPPCAESAYADNRTTLPIDGQVYFFYYCTKSSRVNCADYSYITIYFLAHSDVKYVRPYTWVKDVGPILTLYSRMAPVMKKVLDMSSYRAVTKQHNIHLLNRTLRLDIDDPSYMPTTRDLSAAQRKMILEWLEDPKFSDSAPHKECQRRNFNLTISNAVNRFRPPRCRESQLHFDTAPHDLDPYFNHIFYHRRYAAPLETNMRAAFYAGRPLFNGGNCSVVNLKVQLQKAIELEWSTIPVYLTSLYSIVEGYNTEIYDLIRSIVVQEMLHMTTSANILIAMNGSPLIDDATVIPSFPVTGLTGGVLPNLKVTLEKLSLEHVYKVFMGVEVPEKTLVGYPIINEDIYSIGTFYKEIKDCIADLGDDIFDPSSLDLQVKWPWLPTRAVGTVVPVTDSASAQKAIDVIVSQGEGASILNPDELGSDTLAHFFKFEEIVCQKHLEKVSDFHYAYSGAPILFDPKGVWPMRPNPKASTVHPDTNCHTQSRTFHQVFRMLLRKLQKVFNGYPEEMFVTVQLMESLQVHAKNLMWTTFHADDPNDDTTCGPVWDYMWPWD